MGLKKGIAVGALGASLLFGAGLATWNYVNRHNSSYLSKIYSHLFSSAARKSVSGNTLSHVDYKDLSLEQIASELIITNIDGVRSDSLAAGFGYITCDYATVFTLANKGLVHTDTSVSEIIAATKSARIGGIPPFIGDEGEGGKVIRLDIGLPPAELLGQYYEGSMLHDQSLLLREKYSSLLDAHGNIPATKDTRGKNIQRLYEQAAARLRNHQIDFVFAPVLDIVHNPQGNENALDQADRAYSTNPDTVTKLASLYIDALHGQGIKSIGKHWVGAGLMNGCDPHNGLCAVDKIPNDKMQRAKKPFRQLGRNLDGIMLTHLIDPKHGAPFSFSADTYSELRTIVGDGLLITDDLMMGGVQTWYQKQDGNRWFIAAALDALAAGADAVILKDQDKALEVKQAIMAQMRADPHFLRYVEEKFRRLMAFKNVEITGNRERESIETLAGGASIDHQKWYKAQVRGGDTFLQILSLEDTTLVAPDARGNLFINDPARYRQLRDDFTAVNGVSPQRLKAGRSYLFPDLNGDGIVSHAQVNRSSAPVPLYTHTAQLRVRMPRHANFYWYLAGELGNNRICSDDGTIKPIREGPLNGYYAGFKLDNPGVTSLTQLFARQRYTFRDYNGNGRIDFAKPSCR